MFSDLSGFYALGLASATADPILVVRGTQPTQIDDVFADFQTEGIGFNQFTNNRDAVSQWLDEVSPPDLELDEIDSVDWLNNPFFIYSDLEYATWLAAGQIAVSTIPALEPFSEIPSALLFRSTTENLRQQIGQSLDEIADELNLEVNANSVQVTLPNVDIDLFGVLEIDVRNMTLRYEDSPTERLWIQGTVSLPQLYNVTADFEGDNFIEIRPDGFDVVGQVYAEDITIVPGLWELREAFVGIDTQEMEIVGGGTLLIPAGIEIGASLGFLHGQFNSLSLDFDSLDIPIGTTGLNLNRISGGVANVAQSAPDPVTFTGGVWITDSLPDVSVTLPESLGGEITASLLDFDLDGTIDINHLEADATLSLLGGLATGVGNAKLNWQQGFLTANATFNLLEGFLELDAGLSVDSSFDITMAGTAAVTVPDFFSLPKVPEFILNQIRGLRIAEGSGYFQYRNDEDPTNDFVRGHVKIDIPFPFGEWTGGIQADFAGNVDMFTGDNPLTPNSPSFDVPVGSYRVLLAAEWQNDVGTVPMSIQAPDGTVFTEADIEANADMAIFADFSGPTANMVGVLNPMPGRWHIILEETPAMGEVEYFGLADSKGPTVTVTSPASDVVSSVVPIDFEAFDPDSDASVSLFYDTDQEGLDGLLIAEGLTESDGPASFVWDTTSVAPGEYYVYAIVDDGNNLPAFDYIDQHCQRSAVADRTQRRFTCDLRKRPGDT